MLENLSKEALTVLHVSAWSQIGVLVRIYLDLFFTDGCSGSWGVCLLSQGNKPGAVLNTVGVGLSA